MAFTLPKLPYSFDALEPYIDAKTMEVHYTQHHQAYLDKFQEALPGTKFKENWMSIEYIIQEGSINNETIRNQGGGFYNHNLFWPTLSPKGGGEPVGRVAEAIKKKYTDYATFKNEFTQAALSRFGSGWAWFCATLTGELFICSMPNQDNPWMKLTDKDGYDIPLLGLDVWEHAYYLKYQNRRAEYVEAFWNLVNWEEVNDRYEGSVW